ncbi:NAC family transcription factor [Methanofollis formosanus]|uniref:NAC family transcription factor n=1 Tax=Methanofollis formosanus TaxID=299308 RepID=A0A8G1A3L9_9EURY|nr:NAC family transcription factor [Methanofollis formosanus]QYZ79467.1 NAC family transcription factor [Methanofollis formosanus]
MPDEGKYCTICGGAVPAGPEIRKVLVDGKATGIDRLDRILEDVIALGLEREDEIRAALLERVKAFNYVPTKKADAYAGALMAEYRAALAARR